MVMDERSLIIAAIKNKYSVQLESSCDGDIIDFGGSDAVLDLVKKRQRCVRFKSKSCVQWNNADFLQYIDFTMREFGVSRLSGNTRRDGDCINQLYDCLVRKLGSKMNNNVLRSYIDWWSSIQAPKLTGSGFHLRNLMDDKYVSRFAQRYKVILDESEDEVVCATGSIVEDQEDPSDDLGIYSIGGLPLVVVKRGMVIGHEIAKEKVLEPQKALQAVLRDLSREVLVDVLRITLKNAPYPSSYEFDFIEVANPFLKQKEITEFSDMWSKSYFKDKSSNE